MIRRSLAVLLALAWLAFMAPAVHAEHHHSVACINSRLHGTLLDFTQNGDCDQRIYSPALCTCRDLYVYLPPGYDSKGTYPLLIWLHSYTDDECEFAFKVVPVIDAAIARGDLPPLVVAAPDGSLKGYHHWLAVGSWYVNSDHGRFADYIVEDCVRFMESNFAVCRNREGRAIAGFSMGGFGAYSLGLKNPHRFKVVAGISPPLNMRYVGPDGRYATDYLAEGVPLRDDFRSLEVIGRFYGGMVKIRAYMIVRPVWGRGREAVERVSADNPIELLDRLQVQPGQQDFYAGYGEADELNIDAQVQSFLDIARKRGIAVESRAYPCGDHSVVFMLSALPDMFAWMKDRLHCSPITQTARLILPPSN